MAFKTLIESKYVHKLIVLATHCPRAKDALKTTYYVLLRNLYGIRINANKEVLLRWTIGDVDKYLRLKLVKILKSAKEPAES